jgi:hypothetical protein
MIDDDLVDEPEPQCLTFYLATAPVTYLVGCSLEHLARSLAVAGRS